jgi:hypothetical protein
MLQSGKCWIIGRAGLYPRRKDARVLVAKNEGLSLVVSVKAHPSFAGNSHFWPSGPIRRCEAYMTGLQTRTHDKKWLFTFLDALVVFGTLMIKDGWRETSKVLADQINTARNSFAAWQDDETIELSLEHIELDVRFRDGGRAEDIGITDFV